MSKLEAQIRKALAIANEHDPMAREKVYRAAFKAAERFPEAHKAHFEKLLVNTIASIESEYAVTDDVSPLPAPNVGSGMDHPANHVDPWEDMPDLDKRSNLPKKTRGNVLRNMTPRQLLFPVAGLLVGGLVFGLVFFGGDNPDQTERISASSKALPPGEDMQKLGAIQFGTDAASLTFQGTTENGHKPVKDGGILVTANTNIFANEILKYEEDASYFGLLKLRLGSKPDGNAVLPVVFAGVQNLDAEGNGLLQNDALSNFVHTGRLTLTDAARGDDGSYSWSGILSPAGSEFEFKRPKTAAAFKLFAGVAFEGSSISVELVSLTLFKLP